MITVSLDDKYIKENLKAIELMRSIGFSDEEIQKKYDEQVVRDKEVEQDDN